MNFKEWDEARVTQFSVFLNVGLTFLVIIGKSKNPAWHCII